MMIISFMDTFSVIFHASLGSTIDHSHSLVLILHINFWKARIIVLLVYFLVIDTKGYATSSDRLSSCFFVTTDPNYAFIAKSSKKLILHTQENTYK